MVYIICVDAYQLPSSAFKYMGACYSCCRCQPARDEAQAPLLSDSERHAVDVLLRSLDARDDGEVFTDAALSALDTLVHSDVVDLQRSAALAFAEMTEKFVSKVDRRALELILMLLQSPDSEVQRAAGAALGNLAVNNDNKRLIVEMGGLGPLMKQMMSPNVEVQCNAVGCMTNLASYEANKAKIARSGALLPLVKLANSRDLRVQRNATGALLNMTHSDENRQELVNAEALPVLVNLLSSADPDVQYYCATALSNIAVDPANRAQLAQTEPHLVQHLVHLMSLSSPRIQSQAALVLRNLASDGYYQLETVRCGGLPLLLKLMQSSHTSLVVAAVACLRNISILPENEGPIVDTGFLPVLVDLLDKTNNEEILCHAVSTLRNLCASSERTKMTVVEIGAVQRFFDLLKRVPASVESEIAACIAVLALGDEVKSTLLEIGIVPVLLPLTRVLNTGVQGSCAAALGNLCSKIDNYAPFVHAWDAPDGGMHAFLLAFLESKELTFQHIAAWTVLQLLESEDAAIVTKLLDSRDIVEHVRALADSGPDSADEHSDLSSSSDIAVPALAKRALALIENIEERS